MNMIQFYYINTVLGISSIIKPQKLRSIYHLHPSLKKQPDFLFFCHPLHTKEEKNLIQKIGKTFHPCEIQIVEIFTDLTKQQPRKKEPSLNTAPYEFPLRSTINSLLTRTLPKGFIIFGSDLATRLTTTYTEKKIGPITEAIHINSHQKKTISGCVIHTVSDMTENPDSTKTQERKKQTWNTLKKLLQKVGSQQTQK